MPYPQPSLRTAACRPITSIGPVARVRRSLRVRHTPPLAPASGPRAVLDTAVREVAQTRL